MKFRVVFSMAFTPSIVRPAELTRKSQVPHRPRKFESAGTKFFLPLFVRRQKQMSRSENGNSIRRPYPPSASNSSVRRGVVQLNASWSTRFNVLSASPAQRQQRRFAPTPCSKVLPDARSFVLALSASSDSGVAGHCHWFDRKALLWETRARGGGHDLKSAPFRAFLMRTRMASSVLVRKSTVANLSCLGCLQNRIHARFHKLVRQNHFHLIFGSRSTLCSCPRDTAARRSG